MEVKLSTQAIADFRFWEKSGNKAIQKKIQLLIAEMQKHPLEGLGKPEALKHDLAGKYSRRINREHRIVYDVSESVIQIYSLKGHY